MLRRRAIALVFLASAATGCANRTAHPADAPSATTRTSAIYLGPVTNRLAYDSGNFRLDPPSPRQVPKLSWQHVYRQCGTADLYCPPGAAPTIRLAAIFMGGMGNIRDGTLAYVMQWQDLTCAPVGPARPSGTAAAPTLSSCTMLLFVDASSGADLYSVEGPAL
jgi:hypothetical protein